MELNFLVCLCTQIKLKKMCCAVAVCNLVHTQKNIIYTYNIFFVVHSLFHVVVDTVTKFLYFISLELSDALNMLSSVG